MNRRAAWGAILVASLANCATSPNPCANNPLRVVLIGNSITFGISSQPVGPGYAELLAARLGKSHVVTNLGREGASSLDWVGAGMPGRDLFALLAEHELPADVVTILLGTNDAAGAGELAPIPPNRYGDAIRTLVSRSLAAGATRVVLMTPPPAWFEKPTGPNRLRGYRAQVGEICSADERVTCGPDLYRLLSRRPPDFQAFEVHPSASGHAKIANALGNAILEIDCR